MRKKIQQKLDVQSELNAKKAAIYAFNKVMGTNYKLSEHMYSYGLNDKSAQVIPSQFVELLINHQLATQYPHKSKYPRVQRDFDEELRHLQDTSRQEVERSTKNNRLIGLLVGLGILAGISWFGYSLVSSYLANNEKDLAILKQNTPTEYNADGEFKITFPCSEISRSDLSLASSDITRVSFSCISTGDKSVVYSAAITKYITTNLGTPQEEYETCSNTTNDTTGRKIVKISEAYRSIEGSGIWHDCALIDTSSNESWVITRRIVNNTLYTLSAVAEGESAKDLNLAAQRFFNSFQLLY